MGSQILNHCSDAISKQLEVLVNKIKNREMK